eukprot:366234-Chlamydomonas_euryale.AAC.5
MGDVCPPCPSPHTPHLACAVVDRRVLEQLAAGQPRGRNCTQLFHTVRLERKLAASEAARNPAVKGRRVMRCDFCLLDRVNHRLSGVMRAGCCYSMAQRRQLLKVSRAGVSQG